MSANAAHLAFADQTNSTTHSTVHANKLHKIAVSAISGMSTRQLETETVFLLLLSKTEIAIGTLSTGLSLLMPAPSNTYHV